MKTKIHILRTGYANCYLLEEKGLTLVDTGIKWKRKNLERQFLSRNLNPRDVRLILITHGHQDHFGALQTFLDLCGNPPVMCHTIAAESIKTGKGREVKALDFKGKLIMGLGKLVNRKSPGVNPDILITSETYLTSYGISGKVIPTPGHSSCSLSLLLEDGDALLGDTVMPGRGHKPGPPFFIHDREELTKTYGMLIHHLSGLCYTGHGGPYKADDVIAMMHHQHYLAHTD